MKRFFVISVLLVAVTAIQAQINFGIKGGMNFSKLKFDSDVMDSSNKMGFFVGPTIKVTFPIVTLGLDAAALYDQHAVKLEGDGVEESVKQESIQIPVNVRFGFGTDIASFFIFLGPQFGFNLGDKSIDVQMGEWTFRSSSLSGNAGFGVMFAKHLQVSANYNFALGKTGDYDSKTTKDLEGKLNSWQLGVAYYF